MDNYIYFYNNQRIQLKTGVAPLRLMFNICPAPEIPKPQNRHPPAPPLP
ncbi:MAG: hypothetical protein ACLVHV_08760 [Oscillospiraceae bacterium]